MRVVTQALLCLPVLCTSMWCTSAWSVETTTPTTTPVAVTAVAAPSTAQPASTVAQPTATATVIKVAATATSGNAATIVANQPAVDPTKPLTAEQIAKQKAAVEAKVKALVKDQASRLQQLEKANLEALAQNQELQLKNDNLGVQVQVLQSERSAQMFLYGAATIAVGMFLGFLIASYIYTKRRRQW